MNHVLGSDRWILTIESGMQHKQLEVSTCLHVSTIHTETLPLQKKKQWENGVVKLLSHV